jgi:hypothetical protein
MLEQLQQTRRGLHVGDGLLNVMAESGSCGASGGQGFSV